MKFENPIMNIYMFEVENVVTTSQGDTPASSQTAEQKATTALTDKSVAAGNILTFNF